MLVEASTTRRVDTLQGLKENVIIGRLIPTGEVYRKRYLGEEDEEEVLDSDVSETKRADSFKDESEVAKTRSVDTGFEEPKKEADDGEEAVLDEPDVKQVKND